MQIRHSFGIDGAAAASGPTVVIDVFRAFSAAAYALAAGASEIVLAAEIDEAYKVAARIPGAVLMGEDGGVKPARFDLGNSPGEIMQRPETVAGQTVVHRSSAGTRSARAALDAGADPVFVASLVVASATARAVAGLPAVIFIASGESGTEPSEEDDICARLIGQLLRGDRTGIAAAGDLVASSARARYLNRAAFTHPDDVMLCSQTDRFDFAMRAETIDGLVRTRRVASG